MAPGLDQRVSVNQPQVSLGQESLKKSSGEGVCLKQREPDTEKTIVCRKN